MQCVYFANHAVGCACLRELCAKGMPPALVVAYPPGNAEHLTYEAVRDVARELGLPVWEFSVAGRDALREEVARLAPDVLLSVAWRHLFKKDMLSLPRLGAINVHGSYLPRCRGANPTNWAIIAGEPYTGVTVHFMDEGVDTGDIILQEKIPITDDDTAATLRERQDALSVVLVGRLVEALMAGPLPRLPQDASKATTYRPRTPEQGRIAWETATVRSLRDFVRALTRPYPGAFTFMDGKKVVFWKVAAGPGQSGEPGAPGRLVGLDEDGALLVTVRDGVAAVTDYACPDGQPQWRPGDMFA